MAVTALFAERVPAKARSADAATVPAAMLVRKAPRVPSSKSCEAKTTVGAGRYS